MNHALSVLEFASILDRLVRHSETELGQENCKNLEPSFDEDLVWLTLNQTDEASRLLTDAAAPYLGDVLDLRDRLEFASKGGKLGGSEIYACGLAFRAMRRLSVYLKNKEIACLKPYALELPNLFQEEETIFHSVAGSGEILDEASAELANVRRQIGAAQARALETIQSHLNGKYREYLSDHLYTTRFGRFVLPVKADYRSKVKGIVHDSSSSGATVYIEPEDVLLIGNRLRELEGHEREEIDRILLELSGHVGSVADAASAGIVATGGLDFIFARARLAFEMQGSKPERAYEASIELEGARHPLLSSESAVPLDVAISAKQNLIITGPNTGGKTVAIKNIGLAVAMAQSGLFPKARQCKLGPFSSLFADIGDEQSLEQSLSTFSGHLRNVATAIKSCEPGSLVLMDELGAGTDPDEGAALAKAILVALKEKGAIIIASSHFSELKAFAFETEGFINASMEFSAKTLIPTYHLLVGAAGASHALKIAPKYGISEAVIEQANKFLSQESRELSGYISELDRSVQRARLAQSEADKKASALEKSLKDAEKARIEAEELRSNLRARVASELESALREMRLESERVLASLSSAGQRSAADAAKSQLGEIQSKARARVARSVGLKLEKSSPEPKEQLNVGDHVRLIHLNQIGLIMEPAGDQFLVQVGSIKIKVKASDLRKVDQMPRRIVPASEVSQLRLRKSFEVSTELSIRHMRAENAEQILVQYLDDAVLAGLSQVRIIHGKGEGILKKLTETTLRSHLEVASYRVGDASEGGYGVTIAVLK